MGTLQMHNRRQHLSIEAHFYWLQGCEASHARGFQGGNSSAHRHYDGLSGFLHGFSRRSNSPPGRAAIHPSLLQT